MRTVPVSAVADLPTRLLFSSPPSAHHPFRLDMPLFQLVRESPTENVRGQVAAPLITERALRCNPSVRHRFNWRGDVLTASLAADRVIAQPGLRHVKHRISIGEHKAKIYTAPSVSEIWPEFPVS